MNWRAISVVTACLCFGCAAPTYQLEHSIGLEQEVQLATEPSFLVGVPADGRFDGERRSGSGAATTEAVVLALSKHSAQVKGMDRVARREDAIAQAREQGYSFYVHGRILHWEKRGEEWSGPRDKISVRLQLVEVATGRVLDATTFIGTGGWKAFGDDGIPQDLLVKPAADYAAHLFADELNEPESAGPGR